jgi:hypothetical protein
VTEEHNMSGNVKPVRCVCGAVPTRYVLRARRPGYEFFCEQCHMVENLLAHINGIPMMDRPLTVCETCDGEPATVVREGLCAPCDAAELDVIAELEGVRP